MEDLIAKENKIRSGMSVPPLVQTPVDTWHLSMRLHTSSSTEEDWAVAGRLAKAFGAPRDPMVPIEKLEPHDTIHWQWADVPAEKGKVTP